MVPGLLAPESRMKAEKQLIQEVIVGGTLIAVFT
jgi:hypothetical protein